MPRETIYCMTINIASNQCAYILCKNSRKFWKTFLSVYSERYMQIMVKNIGNFQLYRWHNLDILGSKLVCEEHFLPKYVIYDNGKKTQENESKEISTALELEPIHWVLIPHKYI